jgi:mandelate racemase
MRPPLSSRWHLASGLIGPQGFTGIAMAAVDMAAWDVLAKSAGLSLTRLLGGEENRLQATTASAARPDGAAQEAAESIELGFRCVKFRVGYPDVEQDQAVIRAHGARPAAENFHN